MTQNSHSQINTWMLSALTAIGGFIALQVWWMNGAMATSNTHIETHTQQLVELRADVKTLTDGNTKILIALAALKVQPSQP